MLLLIIIFPIPLEVRERAEGLFYSALSEHYWQFLSWNRLGFVSELSRIKCCILIKMAIRFCFSRLLAFSILRGRGLLLAFELTELPL